MAHHSQKISDEQVEDMREEWSRRRALEQYARSYQAEAEELEKRAAELRKEAAELEAIASEITHSSFARQYNLSIHTVNGILCGNTR